MSIWGEAQLLACNFWGARVPPPVPLPMYRVVHFSLLIPALFLPVSKAQPEIEMKLFSETFSPTFGFIRGVGSKPTFNYM